MLLKLCLFIKRDRGFYGQTRWAFLWLWAFVAAHFAVVKTIKRLNKAPVKLLPVEDESSHKDLWRCAFVCSPQSQTSEKKYISESSFVTKASGNKSDGNLDCLLCHCIRNRSRYDEYIIQHAKTGATTQSSQCMRPISITCWMAAWKTDRKKGISKHACFLSAVAHNQRRTRLVSKKLLL